MIWSSLASNSILTFTGKKTKSILIIIWFFLKNLLANLFLHLTRSIALKKIKESSTVHHLIWNFQFRVHSVLQNLNRSRLNINAINKYHRVRDEKSSKFHVYIIEFHGETKMVAWIEETENQKWWRTLRACSWVWIFKISNLLLTRVIVH